MGVILEVVREPVIQWILWLVAMYMAVKIFNELF